MNECNQPLFINPQWNTAGQNQSAEICGRALAASYDALKAVSPQNFVWGVGLSPRGNDNPTAASDSSTSPVAFLQDLGAWFKAFVAATGRTAPLMDGLDFHPYPIPQSQPFARATRTRRRERLEPAPHLPGLLQRLQRLAAADDRPAGGRRAAGEPERGRHPDRRDRGAGYTGTEVSANADGGVIGQYATQAYQAAWYLQMLDLVACDPNVRIVNIYHLIDETDLAGWQSGLYDVNRTPKQSAATVHDWIATSAGACQGALQPWTPSGVAAAPVAAGEPRRRARSGSSPPPPGGCASSTRSATACGACWRRSATSYTGPISLRSAASGHGVEEIAVGEGAGGRPLVELLNAKTDRVIAATSRSRPRSAAASRSPSATSTATAATSSSSAAGPACPPR